MLTILKEIFDRRSLISELVMKNLKVRYSRPILGFFWAFLSPLLMVTVFYTVFSIILKVEIEEAPFLLYLMSAVFPWSFFQGSLLSSAYSFVDNKNLIKGSNFPPYLIPISIIFTNFIIFLPSLFVILIISLLTLKGLSVFILFLPFVLILHLAIVIGLSVPLAVLYAKWRDTQFILEAVLLMLFYLTPAFYSLALVKASFPALLFKPYLLNPLVGMLNLYRITLLKDFFSVIKKDTGLLCLIIIPVVFAIFVLMIGLCFYRKNKGAINDYLSY